MGLAVLSPSCRVLQSRSVPIQRDCHRSHGRFLYVSRGIPAAGNGALAVFSLDPVSGVPNPITGSPFTLPAAPLPLSVDPNGNFLYFGSNEEVTTKVSILRPGRQFVANAGYGETSSTARFLPTSMNSVYLRRSSGSICGGKRHAIYTIDHIDGSLQGLPSETNPYTGNSAFDPFGRFVYSSSGAIGTANQIDPGERRINAGSWSDFFACRPPVAGRRSYRSLYLWPLGWGIGNRLFPATRSIRQPVHRHRSQVRHCPWFTAVSSAYLRLCQRQWGDQSHAIHCFAVALFGDRRRTAFTITVTGSNFMPDRGSTTVARARDHLCEFHRADGQHLRVRHRIWGNRSGVRV